MIFYYKLSSDWKIDNMKKKDLQNINYKGLFIF